MSLPGHDPVCTVISTTRTAYTCLNCQQAGYARADEKQRIIGSLTQYLGEPEKGVTYTDWELGWRKGIKKAIDFIQTGGSS
jgi:hypothetical protein